MGLTQQRSLGNAENPFFISLLVCNKNSPVHVIFISQSRNLRKMKTHKKSTKSLMYHTRITLTDMEISAKKNGALDLKLDYSLTRS